MNLQIYSQNAKIPFFTFPFLLVHKHELDNNIPLLKKKSLWLQLAMDIQGNNLYCTVPICCMSWWGFPLYFLLFFVWMNVMYFMIEHNHCKRYEFFSPLRGFIYNSTGTNFSINLWLNVLTLIMLLIDKGFFRCLILWYEQTGTYWHAFHFPFVMMLGSLKRKIPIPKIIIFHTCSTLKSDVEIWN